ncbi:MAG: penicillin-binding protein 2 [Bacteroidetes bacterium]|nr:MAG: penicillin-binding protein 2 [Bacteroidota bacterium]
MLFHLNRRLSISAIFIAVALVILAKLFYIQVINTSYRVSADSNVLRRIVQYPARGIIYDRKGDILVYNEAVYDLMVVPSRVKAFDTMRLCRLLEITPDDVRVGLAGAKAYSYYKESLFAKQLSQRVFGRFEEHLYEFPGFYAQPRTLRSYPKPIAAHLLGYVGEVSERQVYENPYYHSGDYIGISGLEKSYEKELRGRNGVKNYMVDVRNRIKGSYADGRYDTAAIAGTNLYLSLDSKLQAYGEKLMAGRRGGVVAIEPASGEILAMVSAPAYDPNLLVGRIRSQNYRSLDTMGGKPLFNRTIMALYPPGSTFKLVNGLIGLQEGVISPRTGYSCHGRYTVGRGVGCHIHPAVRSLSDAVCTSCNAYFCYTFRSIIDNPKYDSIEGGFRAWEEYVHSFGIGRRLGVDLPGELKGIVPTVPFYNRYFRKGGWSSLTIISLAIGQGELCTTPLQMANLAATIANRGYYYTPHIVRRMDGRTLDTAYTKRRVVGVDSTHFVPIVKGMWEAVNSFGKGATARLAGVPGLDICGKTGTSQNPHGEDHSVFIAFAPRDKPKIAIAVYLENEGFGGTWAAPLAGLMVQQYLTDTIKNKYIERYVINRGWN